MRQLVVIYNIVSRAQWREHAFMAAVQGAQMGPEPEWDFGISKTSKNSTDNAMDELQAYIASKKAKAVSDGR